MGLLGGNSTKSVKTDVHRKGSSHIRPSLLQRTLGQQGQRPSRILPAPPAVPSSFPYSDYNSSYKTFQVFMI